MRIAFFLLVLLTITTPAWAALIATGDWSAQRLDATTFRYTIDLHNTGTTNIGTLWFAWVPGEDFLPTAPLSVSSPTGWSDLITHFGSADGYAIQWATSTSPLAPGQSLATFQFDSRDTPAELAMHSPFFKTMPATESFVYIGAPLTDPGFAVVVPEPSGLVLAAVAAALMAGGWSLRRERHQA